MKQIFVLLALIGFGLTSCERHTWETKPEGKSSDSINLFKHENGHAKEAEAPVEGEKQDGE